MKTDRLCGGEDISEELRRLQRKSTGYHRIDARDLSVVDGSERDGHENRSNTGENLLGETAGGKVERGENGKLAE